MFYSDDPARDFDRWDMEQERRRARLPVCDRCLKSINDETFFDFEGYVLCEKCMHDVYGRSTEDYLRDNY